MSKFGSILQNLGHNRQNDIKDRTASFHLSDLSESGTKFSDRMQLFFCKVGNSCDTVYADFKKHIRSGLPSRDTWREIMDVDVSELNLEELEGDVDYDR